MNRNHLAGVSFVALAALVAGACGSATQSASSPTTVTTSPAKSPAKLDLASAGAAATPSAAGGAAAIYPVRSTTYVLDAKLPSLGPSAVVRTMNAHALSATDVQRFADALGIGGTPARTSGGWEVRGADAILTLSVTDGSVTVSYSSGFPSAVGGSPGSSGSSGSSSSTGSSGATGPGLGGVPPPSPGSTVVVAPASPPVGVPSAQDAKTIARGLLDRLGLLGGQQWSSEVYDSGGIAVACPVGVPCPTIPPQVSARTVTLFLMLDGARVHGVDWSVTIGEHRRVESLSGEWASPTTLGSYPLRSPAGVFADLQHGKARYAGPQPMMGVATGGAAEAPAILTSPTRPNLSTHITGVSLGLTRWDAYDHGRTMVDLVPTYRFHARVDPGSSYDIEVLALDPGLTTFTSPAPTPGPKPGQPIPAPPAAG